MRFRFIDPAGHETALHDVEALVAAYRSGRVLPDMLLFDATAERWAPAGAHDVLRALAAAPLTEPAAPDPVPAPPSGGPTRADPGQQALSVRTPRPARRAATVRALQWAAVAVGVGLAYAISEPGWGVAGRIGATVGMLALGAVPAIPIAWAFRGARPYFPALLLAGVVAVSSLVQASRMNSAAEIDREAQALLADLDRMSYGSAEIDSAFALEAAAVAGVEWNEPDDMPWLRPARQEADDMAWLRPASPAAEEQSGLPAPARAPDPPPAAEEARVVRAMRLAFQDVDSELRRRAATRGLDLDAEPAGWLEARYLADAASHSDVPVYFRAYLNHIDEAERIGLRLLTDRFEARLREVRVPEATIRVGIQSIEASFAEAQQSEANGYELARRIARAALDLHSLLLRLGDRVVYDVAGDQAVFEDDADLERVQQLAERIERESAAYFSAMDSARETVEAELRKLSGRR